MTAESKRPRMTDRPILFSAPMVRANLADLKSQTRRIFKPKNIKETYHLASEAVEDLELRGWEAVNERMMVRLRLAPGDRLWVREALERANGEAIGYPADGTWLPNTPWIWRRDKLPSIHMPRQFSRLTLTVTAVKVERLKDISEEDAKAEGLTPITKDGKLVKYGIPDGDGLPGTDDLGWPWDQWCVDPREAYRKLWERINGPGSWEANPWVAAISYRVHRCNIGQLEEAA